MQVRADRLSQLRQKLTELGHLPSDLLSSFLAGDPLIKGTLYTLRRKCSKASCRCMRGELHASLVLTASIKAKTRLWTIAPERIREIRRSSQAYHRFRQARRELLKEISRRRAQMLRIIAAIEKIRLRSP